MNAPDQTNGPLRHRILVIESCDSTNDFIKQRKNHIVNGSPLIVASREQLKGRGRDNREWFSPRGTGLYLSIGFLLNNREEFKLMSLIGGLAIMETLKSATNQEFLLKWPNDVLFGNKKIAGVLIENSIDADKIVSITGMGVNLNQNLSDFPLELRGKVTSLKMITGKTASIRHVSAKLVHSFFRWIEALENGNETHIVETANQLSAFSPGDPVRFHHCGKLFSGTFCGINSDGGLILEKKNGKREIFYSGEIDDSSTDQSSSKIFSQ